MRPRDGCWLDLSLPIQTHMPVYPGDPLVQICRFLSHETDGIQASVLSMSCHAGTHIDAPRHFLKDGLSLEQLPVDRVAGTAYVAAAAWTVDGHIDLSAADFSKRKPEDGLLLATGWDRKAGFPAYYESIPQFEKGSSRTLIEAGVSFFGLDMPTVVELKNPPDPAMMHRLLLGKGIVIIESLFGLTPLIGKRIQFFAFPLLIPGCEASPVRACGYLLS